MKIDNIQQANRYPNFGGALDGVATTILRTLDTNPMINAVGIDLFAMVGPRTYVDTKERNKYAGAETFFREFTGTLIVCLSASYLAKLLAHISNKIIKPEIKINPNSWFSNDSINYLKSCRNNEHTSTETYITNVFNNLYKQDSKSTTYFNSINWNDIEWVDEASWKNFKWHNTHYIGIQDRLKDKKSIFNAIKTLIDDKNITKNDSKNLFKIIELRLVNALKSENVTGKSETSSLSTSMHNILRDTIDLGRDVFSNKSINANAAIEKILKINKIKSIGALAIASSLGLTNQYINRKITEKRTGTKGFVGDTNYGNKIKEKQSTKDTSKRFLAEKVIASLGMAAMAIGVMKVKSPKDFLKKLEFTGPVTGGNAIKTVYAATLIGRFLASDNKDELRETVTRDYFGFLNWLVLGGFAAKTTANILDRKKNNLFNTSKEGKGIKHWLNNVSLKSHNEIASYGKEFAKKNMWKLNLAHTVGLAYSTLMLGVFLPKLNIFITKRKQEKSKS